MIHLKDIAKASGVSLTQVSRALNNASDVSERTKEKVQRVAAELGYVKNINASRLAMKQTSQMSVMIHGFDEIKNNQDNILLSFLTGIFHFAETVDYEVVPRLVSRHNEQSYIDYCKSRSIGGVIFVGARIDDQRYCELIHSDFPAVVVDSFAVGENKACVLIDDEKYAKLATSALITRGYQTIGMINGQAVAHVSGNRLQGYQNALAEHGVAFDSALVKNGDFSFEQAKIATEALLLQGVDAIFCASDLMAFGAREVLQEKGLTIPTDVALFGFDGLMATQLSTPKLSTVVQNNYEKGCAAAQLLYQILNQQSHPEKVLVDCTLQLTDSI